MLLKVLKLVHNAIVEANKRKQARAMGVMRSLRKKILKYTEDMPRQEATRVLGLGPYDMSNLRHGNRVSLEILIRLVRKGRFTPASLLGKGPLRKLPKGTSTRGVTAKQLGKRVREIALADPPLTITKKTGLAAGTVYKFRLKTPRILNLLTVVCLIEAGYDANALIFGEKKKKKKK